MTKTVTLYYAKSTKGTHVYKARTIAGEPEAIIGTVYLEREQLPTTPPAEIELTVSWKEEA